MVHTFIQNKGRSYTIKMDKVRTDSVLTESQYRF